MFVTLLLVLISCQLAGQTRPDLQPEITDPQDTDAFYTQERGTLNKVLLSVLRKYYGADIQATQKGYTPGVGSIPEADYVSFITGSDGNIYYIDGVGGFILLSGGGGGADGNSYVSTATVTGTTTKTLTLERTDGLPDVVETFTDLNTQLSEGQVDTFVGNNGYLTSEVDGSITNELQLLLSLIHI